MTFQKLEILGKLSPVTSNFPRVCQLLESFFVNLSYNFPTLSNIGNVLKNKYEMPNQQFIQKIRL